MAVGLSPVSSLEPIAGVRVAAAQAHVRYPNRKDVVVFEICEGATTAATFTRNAFCAAPVQVARDHIVEAEPRFLVINTGNANAGTGVKGIEDALATCQGLAEAAGVDMKQVLPFSTGVIGEYLPVDRVLVGVNEALGQLSESHWVDAATGIMTTDTIPKGFSDTISINGQAVHFTGICKGAGMIRPNMATMLAFIATDARVEKSLLEQTLGDAVALSFNRVTIDSDTSTNDACVLIASNKVDMPLIEDTNSEEYEIFRLALIAHCQKLAQSLIRDGEGATKFITIDVNGGANVNECESVAFTVAHSPLVKTAFFASDPNWGRILAAIGRASVPGLHVEKIDVYLDDVCIVRQGERAPDYTEARGQEVMDRAEICLSIDLGRGDESATVWTSDLSHDYVKINAEYRT